MTQAERRGYMLRVLLDETTRYRGMALPRGEEEQRRLLRSLMNVRLPDPIDGAFLEVQDAYLREELRGKNTTWPEILSPVPRHPQLFLWQGDITTLAADAIVNAANSGMLGCFVPCHGCIDNAIHTGAGMRLRLECQRLMGEQGHGEPTGTAKLTGGYNLPCRYVLHTVGPIVTGRPTGKHEEQLASCYRSCLALAAEHKLSSIAFCCISTGEFHFPRERAAEIAVETTEDYLQENPVPIKVIFNVFKENDRAIYARLLGAN